MFGKPLHRWHQRGAIIVFTAFLLPLLMACTGLAFDLGNLYIHKSRLQNAADAAALAGAREYAAHSDTEKPPTGSHPFADAEADRYVDSDAQNRNLPNAITGRRYRAQESGDAVYYRVDLTENVPLYFLRIFGLTDQDVSADSVAAIGMVTESDGGDGSSSGSGRDLFLFRHKLKIVNAIENPDNFDMANQIKVTFDGDIAFTDGTGKNVDNASNFNYDELQYSTQTDKLGYFFTEKAREEGLTVNQAIEKGPDYARPRIFEDYDMDELGTSTLALFGVEQTMSKPNWWEDQTAYDEYYSHFKAQKSVTSADLSSNLAIIANKSNGDGNIDISINSAIGGNTSDPVYLYIDESCYMINVNITASNERPLVICYTGTGKLHINGSNGSTFSGVIYAPNVPDYDSCLINNNGFTFEGTIIANYLDIQGGQGTYKYKDFGVVKTGSHSGSGSGSGSGSSTGKKTVKSSSTVRLVSPGDLSWD